MCINNQKLIKKYILVNFLIIIWLISVAFASKGYSHSIIKEIIKFEKENQRLNENIIAKLRFKLSESRRFDHGQTSKFLLEEEGKGDLWLFKIYASSIPVNSTITTYRLAQLLGIDISEITGAMLPINGRRRYGSIQKVISNVHGINKIPFSLLSSKQIDSIMKNQVLDWLTFNTDIDEDEFLVEKKTGRIIVIDKDETFYKEEETSLCDDVGMDSYYYKFWEAYSNSEVKITGENFKKVFELIDYFQTIDDKNIMWIVDELLGELMVSSDFVGKKVVFRKHNLRIDFENFYRNLAGKKGLLFISPDVNKNNTYSQEVLEKLRDNISRKESVLAQLEDKKLEKQINIERVSCAEASYLIENLNYVTRKDFFDLSNKTMNKLKCLIKKVPSINEQFVVNLYLKEIENLQNKRGVESFLQREIKRIILYPDQMTKSLISRVEYNLRIVYGKGREELSVYEKNVRKKPHDILAHLDYFMYPIGGDDREEEELILKEYEGLLNESPNDLIYKVLYGILLKDKKYLTGIEDDFGLKYLGIALVYTFEGDKEGKREREIAIGECKKALLHTNKKEITYLAHMLSGLLYQHNNKWKRFRSGFEPRKSIIEYKKAVVINPKSVKAHLNLGILYLITEEPDKALNEFKVVARLNRRYGKEHFHFNKINEKTLYKEKQEYLEAVKMNTLSEKNHYILGLAWLISGNKKLAQKHFDKAEEFGYEIKNKIIRKYREGE